MHPYVFAFCTFRACGGCPIAYVRREKVSGVPHHAKAGNVNSCLMKETNSRGDFVLVLDCDMMVKKSFLMRTIPHFYTPTSAAETAQSFHGFCKDVDLRGASSITSFGAGNGCHSGSRRETHQWMLDDTAGYLQTPQDFWNVLPSDPLVRTKICVYDIKGCRVLLLGSQGAVLHGF